MDFSATSRAPLWLLPNLYALDAPLVAAVWQRFLAAAFHSSVPLIATLVLMLIVWSVYLLDRVFDAKRGEDATDRHQLAARRWRWFVGAAVAALFASGVLLLWLPPSYLVSGTVVALGVLAYLAIVQILPSELVDRSGTKELLVGMGFAAGVAVPLIAEGPPVPEWLPSAVAFGGLCWLNCRLIERWERGRSHAVDLVLGTAILAAACFLPFVVATAIVSSTLCLLGVHLFARHQLRAARVLADSVLLTPAAVLAVGGW